MAERVLQITCQTLGNKALVIGQAFLIMQEAHFRHYGVDQRLLDTWQQHRENRQLP